MRIIDRKELLGRSTPPEKIPAILERRNKIRLGLNAINLDFVCVIFSIVYANDHKNPSGQFFTTLLNTFVDSARYKAAILILWKQFCPDLYHDAKQNPKFLLDIPSVQFGDDSGGPSLGFTFEQYKEVYEKFFKIEITPAEKARWNGVMSLKFNLHYLSRAPIVVDGSVRMVLPKETIRTILHYRFDNVIPDAVMYRHLADAALAEYFLYGKAEFDARKKELDQELIRNYAQITTLTFSKAFEDWVSALTS